MASKVDALVDEGEGETAAPIMQAAAEKILEGRHKWFLWNSGGFLMCPLAAPLRTSHSHNCHSEPSSPSQPKSAQATPAASEKEEDGCIDLASVDCDSASELESADKLSCQQPETSGEPSLQPLFLARFDAAWIYGELATMYVSYLEKKRQYKEACTLLRALLGGSACPLRRCALRYQNGTRTLSSLCSDVSAKACFALLSSLCQL